MSRAVALLGTNAKTTPVCSTTYMHSNMYCLFNFATVIYDDCFINYLKYLTLEMYYDIMMLFNDNLCGNVTKREISKITFY